MRTQTTTFLVLVMVAMVASQAVITDFNEYQRKKAEYDAQKKVYDEFQSLKSVPFLASTDLIAKKPVADSPPGTAEQLLPNYDGKKITFRQDGAPSTVEPGNTPQNYFHKGPIPAKKSKPEPPPKPFIVPTGPGGFFSVAADDSSTITTGVEGSAGTAPELTRAAPVDAPAAAPAATPEVTQEAALNSAGQALAFESVAPPATSFGAQAAAPPPASPTASLSALTGTRAIPLRPLSPQFLFPPALPHSDFHPGPARAIVEASPVPAAAFAPAAAAAFAPAATPVAVFSTASPPAPAPVAVRVTAPAALPPLAPAPAPLALPALAPSAPLARAAAARFYRPAERYGPPSFFA